MSKVRKAALGALLGAAAAMGCSAASAQMRGGPDSGFYVGGALGQAEFRDGCEGLPSPSTCDAKDIAWRVLGGWQLNRYFAAEIAYTDFGEFTASAAGVDQTVEANAWELV